MSQTIFKALEIFLEQVRPFVQKVIEQTHPGSPWEGEYFRVLNPDKQQAWNKAAHDNGASGLLLVDYQNLDTFAIKFKEELTQVFGGRDKANKFISCIQELKEVRNRCAHYQTIDEDTEERFFSNLKLVAKMMRLNELYDEIKRLKAPVVTSDTQAVETIPASIEQVRVDQVVTAPVEIKDTGRPLVPWFNNVYPHSDIRMGILDESVFAANINDVVNGTGPDVYVIPATFFSKTFITAGLRDIAKRVVDALNGEESENRVISLQTGFGGGKTHTLISLYHIAKAGKSIRQFSNAILPEDKEPIFDHANIAVFTNNTCDVVTGHQVENDLTIYTIWGEIAYQLGGRQAYKEVAENDRKRIAPSSAIIKPILEKAAPSLILIDELADYCVKASAQRVGDSSLFEQTNSFMQTLTEVVAAVPRTVLIATLPASATEVANSAIGQQILDSLETRIVRIGTSIKPVDDEEIFEVVRRRLFESFIDVEAIDTVAERYRKMYDNRRNDLPANSATSAYATKIRKSYPFHPELIDIFRLRWGNDSRFQRTRGVLRLLASIVQSLWKQRSSLPSNMALIHPADVQLDKLPTLTGVITNLAGPQWDTVMQADVYGTSSNAYKIDNANLESELFKFRITQGIATTILMSSIGNTAHRGLSLKELKFRMLRPASFQHMNVDDAINKFEQEAHYLYSSTYGEKSYWFQSKPNVNILLNQAKSEITKDDIVAEILNRLNASKSFISSLNVLIAPTSDVPEQKRLTMIVLPPSLAVPVADQIPNSVKRYIENIAFTRGNSDRVYRNTIFYLSATERGMSILESRLRDFLACRKILSEYAGQLDSDQRRDVQQRQTTFDNQAKEALIHSYTVVIRCGKKNGFESFEVGNFASDMSTQISSNIINAMKEEEFLVDSLGQALLSKHNLLPEVNRPIKVFDLYEAFLRFDDKPMISSDQAVLNTVRKHCVDGTINLAVGTPPNFTKIFVGSNLPPLLSVDQQAEYWMVDESVRPSTPSSTGRNGGATAGGSGNGNGSSSGASSSGNGDDSATSDSATTYKKVTISGDIPMENWAQLFPSFVQILSKNKLQISVKFIAKTTDLSPLTSTSQLYKSIKESASQLGLDLEVEE